MKNNLITELVKKARENLDSPALEIGEISWDYRKLFSAAACWSGKLKNLEDPLIGVYADRSFASFAAILGVVLSGKGYVPLNPRFPVDRNRRVIEASGLHHILVDNGKQSFIRQMNEDGKCCTGIFPDDKVRHDAWKEADWSSPGKGGDPDRIIYLLFTSGSTGTPKGVPVREANLNTYLAHILESFDFKPDDRFSQTFDLTFDLSVHDIFVTWLSGACLVVPVHPSPLHLGRYINLEKITVWFSVPSVAHMMESMRLLEPGSMRGLRFSFFCGEAFNKHLAKSWQRAAPEARVINLYGPTEATIAITSYEYPKEGEEPASRNGILSIGKIFPGQSYRIEPLGDEPETGELLLSGTQVVDGYFKNEQLTRESFEERDGKRWYHTGDIAGEDDFGNLYFLGRKDQEIKFHGYRINLLEIDHTIRKYFRLDEVVTVFDENKGQRRIVSFITYPSGKGVSKQQVMEICKDKLPWYMVPEKIIFVEKMPVNINGKIDRAALKKKIL